MRLLRPFDAYHELKKNMPLLRFGRLGIFIAIFINGNGSSSAIFSY